VFDSNISVMANVGLRLQTRCNLYFNIGGLCGPSFDKLYTRHTNVLLNDYSATYKTDGMQTKLKYSGEISIGFEF